MKLLYTWNHLFRVTEWYDSKVPMLLLPVLYVLVCLHNNFQMKQLGLIVFLLLFYCAFLAFGYLINDYADMDVDRKAGKEKIMHQLPKPIPFVLVLGSVLVGCIPVLWISHDWKTILVLCIIYFFGGSYSIPPFRFKEKGVFGLFVSSTAQRCFPLLLFPLLLSVSMDEKYFLWILLSFFVGMRYILVHQYIDMENDKKSGVDTYVLRHQAQVKGLIIGSFVMELLMITGLQITIFKSYPWMIYFMLGYGLLSILRWRGCKMVYGHGGLYSFDQVPLEDFYNHYLPLVYIIILMQQHIQWGVLLFVWMLILLRPTIKHLEFPMKILVDGLKRKRERKE